jgi:hypothetical protein
MLVANMKNPQNVVSNKSQQESKSGVYRQVFLPAVVDKSIIKIFLFPHSVSSKKNLSAISWYYDIS